uniref:Uncharacterized protein n=1 Tax=Plectus sambesii TaxID=2011161 RepID=A0A914X6R9_9BILA
MSSQKIIVALMVLVAIAAAVPKGGLIPDPLAKTIAVDNDGNSTGLLADCAAQPTDVQCILCHCAWVNNHCVGSTSIC